MKPTLDQILYSIDDTEASAYLSDFLNRGFKYAVREDGVPVGLCGEDGKRSICPVHFHGDVAKTDTICPMCRDIYLKGGKDGTIPE